MVTETVDAAATLLFSLPCADLFFDRVSLIHALRARHVCMHASHRHGCPVISSRCLVGAVKGPGPGIGSPFIVPIGVEWLLRSLPCLLLCDPLLTLEGLTFPQTTA